MFFLKEDFIPLPTSIFLPSPQTGKKILGKKVLPAKYFEQKFGGGGGYQKLLSLCKSTYISLCLVWSLDIQGLSLHVNLSTVLMLTPTTTTITPGWVIGNSTA